MGDNAAYAEQASTASSMRLRVARLRHFYNLGDWTRCFELLRDDPELARWVWANGR